LCFEKESKFFKDGTRRSGKRKSEKVIFESSPTARHLLIYPNSNASILLFNEEDEGKAVGNLYEAIAEAAVALAETTNG
jgi:hypothetical protein